MTVRLFDTLSTLPTVGDDDALAPYVLGSSSHFSPSKIKQIREYEF